jgi:hypothetical protein
MSQRTTINRVLNPRVSRPIRMRYTPAGTGRPQRSRVSQSQERVPGRTSKLPAAIAGRAGTLPAPDKAASRRGPPAGSAPSSRPGLRPVLPFPRTRETTVGPGRTLWCATDGEKECRPPAGVPATQEDLPANRTRGHSRRSGSRGLFSDGTDSQPRVTADSICRFWSVPPLKSSSGSPLFAGNRQSIDVLDDALAISYHHA